MATKIAVVASVLMTTLLFAVAVYFVYSGTIALLASYAEGFKNCGLSEEALAGVAKAVALAAETDPAYPKADMLEELREKLVATIFQALRLAGERSAEPPRSVDEEQSELEKRYRVFLPAVKTLRSLDRSSQRAGFEARRRDALEMRACVKAELMLRLWSPPIQTAMLQGMWEPGEPKVEEQH